MCPGFRGLPTASSHRMHRFNADSASGHRAADETAKCPESLRPISVVPASGGCIPPPQRALPLRHRYYGLMRQSPLVLLSFSLSFVRGVLAGCYQPRLPAGLSRRYLCESFLRCLAPCHGGPTGCACLFLPRCHRPSPTGVWVGFPLYPRTRLFRGAFFDAADISLCSGLRVCSSPRSLLPLRIPPQGS
jgi:hypothetical protein